tara:strand:+ start:966 stop:2042 length:1077 start_codon:yes stop_codon:yes gene_type:complete
MVKVSSPSDFTNIDVNYNIGFGHYTTHTDVSNLLQISAFSDTTTPTRAELGKLIKRAEEKVDDTIGQSYRPIIHRDEYFSFDGWNQGAYPVSIWKDYVGFVQLSQPKIQKLVRLEVWQGSEYKDLASATAKLTLPTTVTTSAWTISLTVGTYTFNLVESTHFYDNFGAKTTASQIVDAINEVFPHKTAKFTGEVAAKSVTANGNSNVNISDFFYATVDSENGGNVIISSLLLGEDGSACNITSNFGTVTGFTDNQDQNRMGDYWMINHEGKIFFHKQFPYVQNHSIRVTYVAGDGRVPAGIHEAATKLVAAEVIRHDDNSILIAETGSNIDLKTKHDILLEEANAIISGKKNIIHFIS